MSGAERAASPEAKAATTISTRRVALIFFLGLVVLYNSNGSAGEEGDAVPSFEMPYALFETGQLSFDTERFPEMFKWHSKAPLIETDDFFVRRWDEQISDKTAAEWRTSGHLVLNRPRYFAVESRAKGTYVSTFGPIPGLVVVPLASVFRAIDGAIADKLALKMAVAKLTASLLVAITYALASSAWAISTQTLWQQTVNQCLLMLGAYFFLSSAARPALALLSGFAFGAATASRITAVFMLSAVLIHLWIHQRRSVLPFVIGALPVPSAIGAYNWHFFGNPLTFGQGLVGHDIALEKTGSPDLWQTPLW